MKRLTEMAGNGYRLIRSIDLSKAQKPHGKSDEFTFDLPTDEGIHHRVYRGFVDPVQVNKNFGFTHFKNDRFQELERRQQSELDLLITREDFQHSPSLIVSQTSFGRFYQTLGATRQEVQVKELERPTFTEFARQISENPEAVWALAPPSPAGLAPQFLIFVPGAQSGQELLLGSSEKSVDLDFGEDEVNFGDFSLPVA